MSIFEEYGDFKGVTIIQVCFRDKGDIGVRAIEVLLYLLLEYIPFQTGSKSILT